MVEDANRGIGSRIRGAARGARDRVTGAADTITGIQFRRQFEEFTDAVARTVVGIHHDQSELRDGLVSLEENQGKLEAAQTKLSAEQEKLRQEFERFRDPRMLVLGFGGIAIAALALGIIALWRTF